MEQSSINTHSEVASKTTNAKKINLAYSLKPIYYFSRVFGSLPFSIVFDSNGGIQTARVKLFDILWFLISIGLNLYFTIQYATFAGNENMVKLSPILVHSAKLIIPLRKLCNCLIIGFDMCNRFKLIEILKNINNFDEKVS